MTRTWRLRAMTAVLLAILAASLLLPSVAWAHGMEDDPPPPGGEEEEKKWWQLIFDTDTLIAAMKNMLLTILNEAIESLKVAISDILNPLTLKSPLLIGDDDRGRVYRDAWNKTIVVAVFLAPGMLALIMAIASKDSLVSAGSGLAEMKYSLAEWVIGILLAILSLYILNQATRLSNAIVEQLYGHREPFRAFLDTLFLSPGDFFDQGPDSAQIIMAVIQIPLGIAVIISLITQYFARSALLLIVVGLAPIVLVLSVWPPLRWLRTLWMKGAVLVLSLGPIMALMLLLLGSAKTLSSGRPLLTFFVTFGIASIMLTINGAVIKGVFSAGMEVYAKVKKGVQMAAQAGAAAGGALLVGGASLGVLPGGLPGLTGRSSGKSSAASSSSTSRSSTSNSKGGNAATPSSSSKAQRNGQKQPGSKASGRTTGKRGGESDEKEGYFARLKRAWDDAGPQERAGAVGAGLRGAGTMLGPQSGVGRAANAASLGMQTAADRGALGDDAEQGPALAGLSQGEWKGLQQGMEPFRRDRDLQAEMKARGLNFDTVRSQAMAPVYAAMQHDTLGNISRQAGFGGADTAASVSGFVNYRMAYALEQNGINVGFSTVPGQRAMPMSDTPAYADYAAGQELAWATGGGDMATYAGLHHAIRRHATPLQAGDQAASDFFSAATQSGTVAGARQAAELFGGQAGVPQDRLDPWLQML